MYPLEYSQVLGISIVITILYSPVVKSVRGVVDIQRRDYLHPRVTNMSSIVYVILYTSYYE